MADARLPLAVDLGINRFIGGTITEYDKGMVNAVVEKRGDRLYITQRPGLDVIESKSFDTYGLNAFITPNGTGQNEATLTIPGISDGTYSFQFTVRNHPTNVITGAGVDPVVRLELYAYDEDDQLIPGVVTDYIFRTDVRDYTAAPYRKLYVSSSATGSTGVTMTGAGVAPFQNGNAVTRPDSFSFVTVTAAGIDVPLDTSYLVLRIEVLERNTYTGAFQFGELRLLDSLGETVFLEDFSAGFSSDWTVEDAFSIEQLNVTGLKGRAAYYWDAGAALYFVSSDTVYRGSYANPIGTISDGSERCYFFAVGTGLVLLDPENGEGWTIDIGGTVTKISDTDFPPNQTPSIDLAHGGCVLNGRLYVLGEDGTIYGSELEDGSSWDALNFVTAERDPDGGTFMGRHHDHVVAMGPRTIEVFYDAAHSTGSPLSRRQDVAYNLGCHSGESAWVDGDRIWFVGVDPSGMLGVYVLESFRPRKVSSGEIDSYLTAALITEGCRSVGCGFAISGRMFYLLTIFDPEGNITSTLVYDDATKFWGFWETTLEGITHFPVMAWSIRTSVLPRPGEGILSNGSLVTVSDGQNPIDSLRASGGWAEDWVEAGWVSSRAGTGTTIAMSSRVGMTDLGTDREKFQTELRVVADKTAEPVVCALRYSNDRTDQWSDMRILDLSRNRKLTRLGKFQRRNYELFYAGSEQVRLEALEMQFEVGR